MKGLLSLPRWSDVLLEVYKNPGKRKYCQKLNRNVKSSINHVRLLVQVLEKADLVQISPTSKIKEISLTEKGKGVAESIMSIRAAINIF